MTPWSPLKKRGQAMVFDPGKIPNRLACWLRGEKDAAGTRGLSKCVHWSSSERHDR